MEKIKTYEQCSLLIKNFKKNNKVKTNFFFLPNDLKAVIANRVIRYQKNEETLIFLIEEKEFSHVFYFIKENPVIVLENTENVMILDLISRENNLNDIKHEKGIWQSVGFKEYKHYIRLIYFIAKDFYKADKYGQYKGCDFLCAEFMDMNAVLRLWETNLDRYSTPLPNSADMEQLIKSGHVYVIKRDGILIGAVYMETASKSCNLKHFVVAPLYRRQGLGTALMDYALKAMALEHIERCYLWVDINNIPAYAGYMKYGFEKDGLCCEQLML